MARFRICPDTASSGQTAMEDIRRQLDDLQGEAVQIRKELSFRIRQREEIEEDLKRIEQHITAQEQDSAHLAECLHTAVETYRQTEQRVVMEYTGETGYDLWDPENWMPIGIIGTGLLPLILNPLTAPGMIGSVIGQKFGEVIVDGIVNKKPSNSWAHGEIGAEGEFLGVDTSVKASGDVLGYDLKGEVNADVDFGKGKVGAGVKGSATGYLLKGELEGNYGYLSSEATAYAGVAAVSAEAGAYLFKEGEFCPEAMIKAKAEANALSGSIKNTLGTEDFNVHSKAEGAVGTASAEVECGFSKDEGFKARAEVGAAIASGTVEGGFTLFGWNVDLGITGEAGAVGAGGGMEVSANSFELEGKLAALVGLGIKIRVSRST